MSLSSRNRTAFTLVEILTVLVVIAIMAGMMLTAVQGVTQTARVARTRSIIATVDSVIQEQYDSYKFRPYSVEPPDLSQLATGGDTLGYELLSTEAARVRMLMIRDLQRMEMPDRLSDIADAPTLLSVAANPVLRNTVTEEILGTRGDKLQRKSFFGTWFDANATYAAGGHNIPSKLASYRDRIPATWADGSTAFSIASTFEEAANQGAECLYLIMATSFVGGQPAISAIPAANIGDTDGDNLLEILDGWGQPLGFIRWPIGYNDPQRSIDATKTDDLDPFRSDFAYRAGASMAQVRDVNYVPPDETDPLHPFQTTTPWSMRPLIVSAGADGEFGITFNPWTDETSEATENIGYSYRANAGWTVDSPHMGDESQGRTGVYQLIDPFMRNYVGDPTSFTGLLIGQDILGSDAAEERVDNITNYAVQSEQ